MLRILSLKAKHCLLTFVNLFYSYFNYVSYDNVEKIRQFKTD